VVYIKLPVQRSEPVMTTIVSPYGKTKADIVRIRPAALSWYHGDEFVLKRVAHANDRSIPALTELKKILSGRILWSG
jgi:hypothetical protein